MLEWLNFYAPAIQVVSTIVLIAVTAVYVIFTYKIFSATKQQKDLSILPIILPIKFHLSKSKKSEEQDRVCVDCVLKNSGNGPAKNILVSFVDADSEEVISKSTHTLDLINKGEESELHIHFFKEDLENVKYQLEYGKMTAFIKATVEFQDFSNNKYQTIKTFALIQKTGNMEEIVGSFDFEVL